MIMGHSGLVDFPLFPLHKVLFPYVPLQLQVFEQRYLTMIADVLKNGERFGVVPIVRGGEVGAAPEIFPFGTLVSVLDWQQLPNGLLGIRVMGEQRFRVMQSEVDSRQLTTSRSRLFIEDLEQPLDGDYREFKALIDSLPYPALKQHLASQPDDNLCKLSWLLAEALPLDTETQCRLLAEQDNGKRLALIQDVLEKLLN